MRRDFQGILSVFFFLSSSVFISTTISYLRGFKAFDRRTVHFLIFNTIIPCIFFFLFSLAESPPRNQQITSYKHVLLMCNNV